LAAARADARLAVRAWVAVSLAARAFASCEAAACFLVVSLPASSTREESRVASWRAWMRAVVMPDSCPLSMLRAARLTAEFAWVGEASEL
jgi:hypothetical protein